MRARRGSNKPEFHLAIMTATKHILAIHAHPDDVEMLCAGTLTLLAAKGHRISIVSMTPGDCGSADRGPEEIAAVRREEASRSAQRIGAEYRCAEFRDLSIFVTDSARRRVTGLLRDIRPEIVLTSSAADYHCDHEATSALVRDACFGAPAPNYTAEGSSAPPLAAIPHLYFVDPIEARADEPRDFFVDVSSVFATKRAMLAEHRSQRDWLAKHHGIDDYLEQMERWCAQTGGRAGVQFAEGFMQCHRHSYPQTPLLQELLGEYLRV
jgi:LmbE family N-acetylglucosaminyl deacetylase